MPSAQTLRRQTRRPLGASALSTAKHRASQLPLCLHSLNSHCSIRTGAMVYPLVQVPRLFNCLRSRVLGYGLRHDRTSASAKLRRAPF